jgi:hypothetical protein
MGSIVVYKPEEIVYIDEAGMDNRENYSYGWNERDQRFYELKSGRRQGRINMIAGFCNGQLFAPFTVESSCNRTVFETWLEACLIPTLKPGQILIVSRGDNKATKHSGAGIKHEALVENLVVCGV